MSIFHKDSDTTDFYIGVIVGTAMSKLGYEIRKECKINLLDHSYFDEVVVPVLREDRKFNWLLSTPGDKSQIEDNYYKVFVRLEEIIPGVHVGYCTQTNELFVKVM